MAHTLEEADRMVKTCADAGVPLSCGAITTTHPSSAKARELIRIGTIGDVLSIEARGPGAQHQNWSYFLESPPAWVIGTGDQPRRETGSDEFVGQGILVAQDGQMVHIRRGRPVSALPAPPGSWRSAFKAGGACGGILTACPLRSGSRCPGPILSLCRHTVGSTLYMFSKA